MSNTVSSYKVSYHHWRYIDSYKYQIILLQMSSVKCMKRLNEITLLSSTLKAAEIKE